jgi:hypothetical protein
MRFRLLALSLLGIAAAVPPAEPGLKIIDRETVPAMVIESTRYTQTDRCRVEMRALPQPGAEPLAQRLQSRGSAHIVRCDRQKLLLLNYDDRTYLTRPLLMHPTRAQVLLASLASRKPATPKPPNLLIETTTVRTGEWKAVFGYSARRVITTERHIPLDAPAGPQRETEIDGWYIDLETKPACERAPVGRVHWEAEHRRTEFLTNYPS